MLCHMGFYHILFPLSFILSIILNGFLLAIIEPKTFEPWIVNEMKKYEIPGSSIAVVRNYEIVYTQGFGFADLASKREVKVDTLFQAASISKPVTAMAILTVFDIKNMNINENVNTYLHDWHIPENFFTKSQPVTLKHLLEHSAGIDITYYKGYAANEPLPSLLESLKGVSPANNKPIEIVREPGKEYKYSGGGYLIVQKLLEDIYKGQSFSSIMDHLVIEPLKMTRTSFNQDVSENEIALAYITGQKRYPGGEHRFIEQAVGGLWSTPSDLSKFMIAIQKALNHKPTSLPSQKVAEELMKPTITPHQSMGFEVQMDKYGDKLSGGSYFFHGGFNPGYLALLLGDTVAANGVVLMVNISSEMGNNDVPQWNFLKSVVRYVADEEGWR